MDSEILGQMQESPFENAFLLLETLTGVGQLAAASILVEAGTDLAPFPTAERSRLHAAKPHLRCVGKMWEMRIDCDPNNRDARHFPIPQLPT